jgi:hypothetical protein
VESPDLFLAKLSGLVRGHWGDAERTSVPFPGGAGLQEGRAGWVLAVDDPARALGPALLWARRAGIDELHVLAEAETGRLARRASAFTEPPRVWRVEGGKVSAAAPAPVGPAPAWRDELGMWQELIRTAGAEPVIERGALIAEVRGLEVARVIDDGVVGRLEVGVGKHDRHAQELVWSEVPSHDALAAAVAAVREYRRADAPPHPLNRLGPERWLRALLVARPELAGARQLAPAAAAVERDDLRLPSPAPATGVDASGGPVVVVCSAGIDVDLVPTAVDARLADGGDVRLVLVVPERDNHSVHSELAAALIEPAEVRTVSDNWRAMASLR